MRDLETYKKDNAFIGSMLKNPKDVELFYNAYISGTYRLCSKIIKEILETFNKRVLVKESNLQFTNSLLEKNKDERILEEVYNATTNLMTVTFDNDSLILPSLYSLYKRNQPTFYVNSFLDVNGNTILLDSILKYITTSLLTSPMLNKNTSKYLDLVKKRIAFCLNQELKLENFSYHYEGAVLKEILLISLTNISSINQLCFNKKWEKIEAYFEQVELVRKSCFQEESVLCKYVLDTVTIEYDMERIFNLMTNAGLENLVSSLKP